jgi:hypothetical protein
MERKCRDVSPRMATKLPGLAMDFESSAHSMTGVFNNKGPLGPSDTGDLGYIARDTCVIDSNYCFGVRLPTRFQHRWIKVVENCVHIAEVGSRTHVSRRIGRGQESVRAGDNAISGSDIQNLHGKV